MIYLALTCNQDDTGGVIVALASSSAAHAASYHVLIFPFIGLFEQWLDLSPCTPALMALQSPHGKAKDLSI